MMKQLPASVSFLYDEVLKEEIDFDFNIKMKKPSRMRLVAVNNHGKWLAELKAKSDPEGLKRFFTGPIGMRPIRSR